MKRNLKALGLMLAAVFAMSALGATAASAAEFHAASAPVTINGTQSTGHQFKTDAGTVTCKVATFTGTQSSKTSATVTMTPTYKECTAFGFINVPIHTNGCAYIFNANGNTEVECPAGKTFEITAPGCTTKVGPQSITGGNTFTNNAGKTQITVDTDITGKIAYNECGSATTGGTYTGGTTVTGAGGVAVWWE
jgi:hypothetical protein